jgi:ketosteroid isomerase-like protein
MRVLSIAAPVFLLAIVAIATAASLVAPGDNDASFRAFLREFERGVAQFINGDPALWKQNASHRDDVTIMGAWGAFEKGWTEADRRYDWAAARFEKSGAVPRFEYISSGVSGDLAYTVAIERSAVRVAGQSGTATMPLRVTHVFRKEDGAWKLVHRHADPLMDKTAPDTVLKK